MAFGPRPARASGHEGISSVLLSRFTSGLLTTRAMGVPPAPIPRAPAKRHPSCRAMLGAPLCHRLGGWRQHRPAHRQRLGGWRGRMETCGRGGGGPGHGQPAWPRDGPGSEGVVTDGGRAAAWPRPRPRPGLATWPSRAGVAWPEWPRPDGGKARGQSRAAWPRRRAWPRAPGIGRAARRLARARGGGGRGDGGGGGGIPGRRGPWGPGSVRGICRRPGGVYASRIFGTATPPNRTGRIGASALSGLWNAGW